jgi:hypothetical protein
MIVRVARRSLLGPRRAASRRPDRRSPAGNAYSLTTIPTTTTTVAEFRAKGPGLPQVERPRMRTRRLRESRATMATSNGRETRGKGRRRSLRGPNAGEREGPGRWGGVTSRRRCPARRCRESGWGGERRRPRSSTSPLRRSRSILLPPRAAAADAAAAATTTRPAHSTTRSPS